jgi:hypothetical protein
MSTTANPVFHEGYVAGITHGYVPENFDLSQSYGWADNKTEGINQKVFALVVPG